MYIDKLNQLYLESVAVSSKQRYWVKRNAGVNVEAFCDLSQQVVEVESSNLNEVVKPIETKAVDGNLPNVLQMKVDELKETSANRDFSQGATSSGVTAAAAIAALQEAGNKQARDVQSGSYRAFTEICYLIIENIRQFYDEGRSFRVTGEKADEFEFVDYSNKNIKAQADVSGRMRRPVFDIKVKPQRKNPYTKAINNETIKELFGMGFFNPELADQALIAIGSMDFEGKAEIQREIAENKTLYDTVMQLQAEIQRAAMVIEQLSGRPMGEASSAPQMAAQPKQGNAVTEQPKSYSERLAENATPKMENAAKGTEIQ